MNKKGFAITGFIYTIFIIFIVLMIIILSLFNSRKTSLDKLKNQIEDKVNSTQVTINKYDPITKSGYPVEFVARSNGYYRFSLYSPKLDDIKGTKLSFEIYLSKGDTLFANIGSNSYNGGSTSIIINNNDLSSYIATVSNDYSLIDVKSEYKNSLITNVIIEKNINDGPGKVEVDYLNKIRKNISLNKVKYIKNCISGNNQNDQNNWSEIRAFVGNENKALGKILTGTEMNASNPMTNITDGDITTYATSNKSGQQCVIMDLGRTFNLDYISIIHELGKVYFENKTYVSEDGQNYVLVKDTNVLEEKNGILISAFQDEQTLQIGEMFVPIEEFDGSKWLRVYHHNNMNGTVLWNSLSQVSNDYDQLYKQNILNRLDNYKAADGFEFMLKYSDVSGYNRWIQTSNPLKTVDNVTGFKDVFIGLPDNNFSGLSASKSGDSLLYGNYKAKETTDKTEYYQLGIIVNQGDYNIVNETINTHYITDLWLKIN